VGGRIGGDGRLFGVISPHAAEAGVVDGRVSEIDHPVGAFAVVRRMRTTIAELPCDVGVLHGRMITPVRARTR